MSDITPPSSGVAAAVLRWTGGLWFLVAAVGQLAFIGFILAFYGVRTATGDFAGWNDKPLIDGYTAGDDVGNVVFAVHVLLASVVTLAGLMQMVPQIRRRWPRVHRWSGRVFFGIGIVMALSGIWLALVRGTVLSPVSGAATVLNGVLILIFAALAWRYAIQRRFDQHRLWAIRTFMVISGVWFLRVGIMGWVLLNRGPVGMTDNMSGPADIVLTFGSYLIPLALLEVWFAATRSHSAILKLLASVTMIAATLYTAIGVFGAVAIMWAPHVFG